MDRKHCSGCRNDFYNGHNPYGIAQCWSFKTAKLVWRIPVGMWEPPPYHNKNKKRVPDCWQGEGSNRIIYVKPESIRKDGYWK